MWTGREPGKNENNVANDAEISRVLKKLSNCYPIWFSNQLIFRVCHSITSKNWNWIYYARSDGFLVSLFLHGHHSLENLPAKGMDYFSQYPWDSVCVEYKNTSRRIWYHFVFKIPVSIFPLSGLRNDKSPPNFRCYEYIIAT